MNDHERRATNEALFRDVNERIAESAERFDSEETEFVCDGRPTLALVPGDRRADENKVAAAAGTRYARVARPDEVLAATGFVPGGVAPFPAPGISQVLMAGDLLVHDRVWIGAGSERHMAGLSPFDLARLTNARTADLS